MSSIYNSDTGMEEDDEMISTFAVIIAFTVFAALLMLLFDDFNLCNNNNNENKHIIFYVLFEFNVRPKYKAQTKETLNILMNGVQTVMKKHVERPAVLLLLATSDAYYTALNLAKTLALLVLVTYGYSWSNHDLDKILMKGSRFSAFEDYWIFHKKLVKRIQNYKVVVVDKFQAVHPQVSTVLCNIADDAFSPIPRSVIILVMDINNYFTQNALATKSGVNLAESYLQTTFGPFLDHETINDLMRIITGRSVIINRENDLENI